MTATGQEAPSFTLDDHFGRSVRSAAFAGRANYMLLFYPLDWTPT